MYSFDVGLFITFTSLCSLGPPFAFDLLKIYSKHECKRKLSQSDITAKEQCLDLIKAGNTCIELCTMLQVDILGQGLFEWCRQGYLKPLIVLLGLEQLI